MIIIGFFRCECGKIHSIGGTTQTSVCKCGRNLMIQLMEKK